MAKSRQAERDRAWALIERIAETAGAAPDRVWHQLRGRIRDAQIASAIAALTDEERAQLARRNLP